MFHMFQFGHHPKGPPLGGGLLFNGLLCVFIGFAIFAAPELLSFFVATILIIIGASLLSAWWKIRNWRG